MGDGPKNLTSPLVRTWLVVLNASIESSREGSPPYTATGRCFVARPMTKLLCMTPWQSVSLGELLLAAKGLRVLFLRSLEPALAGCRSKDRVVTQSAAAWGTREESLRQLNGEILRRASKLGLL